MCNIRELLMFSLDITFIFLPKVITDTSLPYNVLYDDDKGIKWCSTVGEEERYLADGI